jgi:hypothetical protein
MHAGWVLPVPLADSGCIIVQALTMMADIRHNLDQYLTDTRFSEDKHQQYPG